jgi:ribonucleoside-diphosphate reductase alpha chain
MKITEPRLSENALEVAKKRYLKTDLKGRILETPGEMMWRVAKFVAKADMNYNGVDVEKTAENFYKAMAELRFIPGGRILFEAGNDAFNQFSHCFVLGIEDSIASIFKTLGEAAVIQKNDGGTGFNFSQIRPCRDKVKNVPNAASGPVDFIEVYDAALGRILQGGKRHGGNMAILNCDHPDIILFCRMKELDGIVRNFNISVGVPDQFMEKVDTNEDWQLIHPRIHEVVQKIKARELFFEIVKNAWKTGDPGMIFLDAMERDNPTPTLGKLEATNPCGEQPLLPYESCNLGSLVLSNFVKTLAWDVKGSANAWGRRIDWDLMAKTVSTGIHFLDNIIDVNTYVLPEIESLVKNGNRKVGLGVMGFAEMLFKLGIPYNSETAVAVMDKIMTFIQEKAMEESVHLAYARGVFPNFDISAPIYTHQRLTQAKPAKNRDYWINPKRRNATMITIAPTGTISMLANTSSGIEPVFSLVYVRRTFFEDTRNKSEGGSLLFIDPVFEQVAKRKGFYSKNLMERIAEEGSVQKMEEVPEDVKRVFVTTHDIPSEWHVRIQAACQRHVDNSVSKTINFCNDATVEDVRKAYMFAWKAGCKGITIYRDRSKQSQVYNTAREGLSLTRDDVIPETISPIIAKATADVKEICPECEGKMLFKEGCATCSNCSYSYCKN